jgi:hypothetical protein
VPSLPLNQVWLPPVYLLASLPPLLLHFRPLHIRRRLVQSRAAVTGH